MTNEQAIKEINNIVMHLAKTGHICLTDMHIGGAFEHVSVTIFNDVTNYAGWLSDNDVPSFEAVYVRFKMSGDSMALTDTINGLRHYVIARGVALESNIINQNLR